MPGPSLSTVPSSLRLAVTAPASLDPRDLDTPDSLLLASQVFDGLVAYAPVTLEVVPAAAGEWEVLDGGQRFLFRLRQNATFHDGTPVLAEDFVSAWNRLADPIAAKPFAFLLERVEGFQAYQDKPSVNRLSGVVATDEATLEVSLASPWPDFVSLLGHPALSPVPQSASGSDFGLQPSGNGPYRVAAPLAPGTPIVLERFEEYYAGRAAVPTLEFRAFDDTEAGWPEFLSGELDVTTIPTPLLAEGARRFGDQGIVTLARLLYCGFNEADARFQDPALRTAVSLAVDRDVLAQRVYGGVAVPATGIVPPALPGHRPDSCGDLCRRDLDRAADLVADVPSKYRTFALDYASSSVGDELAAALSAQLAEVGLTATPRPHDEVGYQQLLIEGKQELFCLVFVADYPRQGAMLEPLLLAGSPENQAEVEDERLNALLEEAGGKEAPRPREALYAEVERRALGAMHVIPLAWFRSHLAAQPYVKGLAVDPLARFDASTLSIAP